jgi:hypothetical protein
MIFLTQAAVKKLTSSTDMNSIYDALQLAIELEHSTIPLYLYALYSLAPGKNEEISEIIQSVVVEEMLHMTLASNILNAIGGSPVIDSPGFIPHYPGPLPGGVESQLRVHLAPFSMQQIEAFLTIEEPEHPLSNSKAPPDGVTIGEYYGAIRTRLKSLPASQWSADRNQVSGLLGAFVVSDFASASKAIDTIVDQGEGTSNDPFDGDELAHYYRYMEIKMGHKLIKDLTVDPPYSYKGDPVPYDPTGVYPVDVDPSTATYVRRYGEHSGPVRQNNTFNYTYTSLLGVLHQVFNGDPTQLSSAVGMMFSLKGQAKAMMSDLPGAGTNIGPSFEYQPANPPTG